MNRKPSKAFFLRRCSAACARLGGKIHDDEIRLSEVIEGTTREDDTANAAAELQFDRRDAFLNSVRSIQRRSKNRSAAERAGKNLPADWLLKSLKSISDGEQRADAAKKLSSKGACAWWSACQMVSVGGRTFKNGPFVRY